MEGVKDLDLYMYAGEWFEIGRNSNPWQKECTYAITRYYVDDQDREIRRKTTPELDFESDCINSSGEITKTSRARARIPDSRNMGALKAKWENSPKETWMIVYDTDYFHYTIEGDKEKKYLWIMSRSPEMCIDMMKNLLIKARQLGFDIEDVEFAPDTLVDCPAGYYENEDSDRDMSYSPGCGCGISDEEDNEKEKRKKKKKEKETKDKEEDFPSYSPRSQGRRRGRRRANRRNI